jgi:hypothetical protein
MASHVGSPLHGRVNLGLFRTARVAAIEEPRKPVEAAFSSLRFNCRSDLESCRVLEAVSGSEEEANAR